MELTGQFIKALAALGPYTCFRPYHNGDRGEGALAYAKRYLGGYRAFHVTPRAFPICILIDPLEKLEFDKLVLEPRGHLVTARLRDMELLLASEESEEEVEEVEEECKTEASFPTSFLEAVVTAAAKTGGNIEIKTVEGSLTVGVVHDNALIAVGTKADYIDTNVSVVIPPAALLGAVKALTMFDKSSLCVGQKVWLKGENDRSWIQVYIK
ncbi:MAG: hypothetical protein ACK4SY_09270 [Pyrobaculum sp.]